MSMPRLVVDPALVTPWTGGRTPAGATSPATAQAIAPGHGDFAPARASMLIGIDAGATRLLPTPERLLKNHVFFVS